MKTLLIVAVMLSVSACATAPVQPLPYLIVSGPDGEVLRVQSNGKIRWKVRRDVAARAMIGLLLQKDAELAKVNADLAACKNPKPVTPAPAPVTK